MKNRIFAALLFAAMLITLIPSGAVDVPAQAEDEPDPYKTENVEVPEGWLYYEIDEDDDFYELSEMQRKDDSRTPMFIRVTKDIEMKDRWVGRFNHACLHMDLYTTTIFDFNGHRIDCDIIADQNGDNHTWIGLNVILNYGLVEDQYFRIVDSVGGGQIYLTAYTDVDGPTTALMIQSYPEKLPQWGDEPVYGPYYSQGVKVFIDGGRFIMYSHNEKFCLVQSGPLLDSNLIPRWGGWAAYARSAVALSGVKATINKGRFRAIYPTDRNGVADDMGRRFMSDLGLVDSYSASNLRINGGLFDGTCYSVYTYYNMSIYADDEWMRKLNPMPVINGGEFKGGIQFCSTRTSFWRKLRGAYDLNPKMKDVKISEIMLPGAKVYMDGKLVDVNSKDLEDIAWPHDVKVESGPYILETRTFATAVSKDGNSGFLVHYNKTPDSVSLEEYITVIRPQGTVSYWTEAEGWDYTLQSTLGENWYNFFIPAKNKAATGRYRAVAAFGDVTVTSEEVNVEFIDFSDFDFTYGPVWHDGNGEGVAYVDFDVSHRNAVKAYRLFWLVQGDHWRHVEDAPYLNQDYNGGKFRFYIPELADKDNDATTYCIIVTYEVGGVERNIYSDEHVYTEADLGAPMDPYSVALSSTECVLSVGESKTVYVTLYPTATPHKEGFNVEYTNSSAIQIDAYNTAEEFFTFTAKAEGTCIITVTAQGGAYAECKVTVIDGSVTYAIGDIDRDGKVTSDDAVYLLRHTLFPEAYPIYQYADFDLTGKITSDDAVYLLRHTLFSDAYPLK